jgi:methylphosphotriester-DNA--protein-cysteine methyltransferase
MKYTLCKNCNEKIEAWLYYYTLMGAVFCRWSCVSKWVEENTENGLLHEIDCPYEDDAE